MPESFASNAGHVLSGLLPSAIFTPRMSSLIATEPSPLQSPTHVPPPGVGVTMGPVAVSVPSPMKTLLRPWPLADTSQAAWSPIDKLAPNWGLAGAPAAENTCIGTESEIG